MTVAAAPSVDLVHVVNPVVGVVFGVRGGSFAGGFVRELDPEAAVGEVAGEGWEVFEVLMGREGLV